MKILFYVFTSLSSFQTTDSSSMATHVATRRCLCGECAVLHTVFKESSNKGRKFWKCGKGDGSPCKFFEWDDEPPHSQTRGNWAGTGLKSTGAVNDQGDDSGADACFKVNDINSSDFNAMVIDTIPSSVSKRVIGPKVCSLHLLFF